MLSKIMIDINVDGKPVIKVSQPVEKIVTRDVRDKLVDSFFKSLGGYSRFVGVVDARNGDKDLIPMDIPHVLEWLHKHFWESRAGIDNKELTDEVDAIFSRLHELEKGE